uniref:sulfiredoxin n=1 Tax=Brassica campestris TaxID=3711 RepID=M4FBE6_BRACM
MANLMMLRFPSSLRSFSVSASSSNGSPPVIGGSSGGVGPMIVELPLEKIRRPLMRTRSNDQNKVKELMDSIRQIGLQVPIDVIEVDGAYYGFSGCHRYEAHQKLGLPTIRCKIRKGTKETLSCLRRCLRCCLPRYLRGSLRRCLPRSLRGSPVHLAVYSLRVSLRPSLGVAVSVALSLETFPDLSADSNLYQVSLNPLSVAFGFSVSTCGSISCVSEFVVTI